MNSNTFTCAICHGVNSASHVSCKYCGTIPAKYSPLAGKTAVLKTDVLRPIVTEVICAFGCERQDFNRSFKLKTRTAELTYYAEPIEVRKPRLVRKVAN